MRRSDIGKHSRHIRTPLPSAPRTVGEHVHRERKRLGLKQVQLAEMLGVSDATVGSWETNLREPSGRVRQRVIAWLGFEPTAENDASNT
ncbi:MAG: helix-turn-helix transcriptional regulator [Verrucomicrobia bacterium]|nr:helix-turn-helix transcriptional regulator [Verrucomicrobiota bacterium]